MNYDIGLVPLLDSTRRPQRFPLHLPALETQEACVVQLVHYPSSLPRLLQRREIKKALNY